MKTPIVIAWQDHHERVNDPKEWSAPTPPAELYPVIVYSSGYLVSQNDEMVELARDIYEEDGEVIAGGLMRIMRKCILSPANLACPSK